MNNGKSMHVIDNRVVNLAVTDASHNDTGDNVGFIPFLQDSFAYLSICKLQI